MEGEGCRPKGRKLGGAVMATDGPQRRSGRMKKTDRRRGFSMGGKSSEKRIKRKRRRKRKRGKKKKGKKKK